MLIGAIGCNIAWGIIDGVLYLMGSFADRGASALAFRGLRRTSDPVRARELLTDVLPPAIAAVMQPAELDAIRERLLKLPEPPRQLRVTRRDLRGALGVFLIVFLSTFPVAVPFIFMHDAAAALRVSNVIAMAMLFIAGSAYGRSVGGSPLGFGFGMVVLGGILVGLTIALGG
jgi:VIT1/CCC1 family predicted Fe2+/Mn2+ transporter